MKRGLTPWKSIARDVRPQTARPDYTRIEADYRAFVFPGELHTVGLRVHGGSSLGCRLEVHNSFCLGDGPTSQTFASSTADAGLTLATIHVMFTCNYK